MIIEINNLNIGNTNINMSIIGGALVMLSSDNTVLNDKFISYVINKDSKISLKSFDQESHGNRINYIPKNLAVKMDEEVVNNIAFWSHLTNSDQMLSASVHYFGLSDILDKKCKDISPREVTKVALARLLACYSDLWIIDLPHNHDLNEEDIDRLKNAISIRVQERGIVICTNTINFNLDFKASNFIELYIN